MFLRKLFSVISGLQFAFVQFGIFLILQINVSSTYVTYALVSICWMGGVIIGIWSGRGTPMKLVAAQLAAYYFIYLVVGIAPFSGGALPLASLATVVAGVWAGRFFTELLHGMKSSAALFFHENNGFTAGIPLFFVGFTMLGSDFLLAAPAVTFALLFASKAALEGVE